MKKSNKVLFTAPLPSELRSEVESFLKNLNCEIFFLDERKKQDIPNIEEFDIMISHNPFTNNDFSGAKNLKVLILSSTGIDYIPDYFMDNDNLIIANNYGGYAVPISEWILMSALMGMKNIPSIYERARNKVWGFEKNMFELTDKKVLIYGAGRIASEASKRFRCFGSKVVGYRRSGKANPDFDLIIDNSELENELQNADIVVMTLPATDETFHIIDDKALSLMKDDAVIINISRGKTIDEKSLIKHLNNGKFRFVALDVFENEPLSEDSPLWSIDRVLPSTHTCWVSQKRDERVAKHIMDSVKEFVETGTVKRPADKTNRY